MGGRVRRFLRLAAQQLQSQFRLTSYGNVGQLFVFWHSETYAVEIVITKHCCSINLVKRGPSCGHPFCFVAPKSLWRVREYIPGAAKLESVQNGFKSELAERAFCVVGSATVADPLEIENRVLHKVYFWLFCFA